MSRFSCRIGTTSYIIPADIIPNVRYLADQVNDVELVIFEVEDHGQNNLLNDAQRKELIQLAHLHDLSYTVHLPLDLRLASAQNSQHISLVKARRVIDCTHGLNPWAYILHLDGREELEKPGSVSKEKWIEQAVCSLEILTEWVGDASLLAVENLDDYPLDFCDEVFNYTRVSRCIDIGHLWKDGHDPVAYLEKNIHRARVLHIHGISERDHKSLSHVHMNELMRVIDCINASGFNGILTIEIFNEEDFHSSVCMLQEAMRKLNLESIWEKK